MEKAENAGTYVSAHLYTDAGSRRAVECGVHSLEHCDLNTPETARLCRMEGRIGAAAPRAFADLSLLTGQGRHMPLIMRVGEIVKHAAW